ncbi:MAP3K7 C-terminal-like protein [Serinus canaria]|nr:MAP3K7 C-terminal-like protein [Serinus canaria]
MRQPHVYGQTGEQDTGEQHWEKGPGDSGLWKVGYESQEGQLCPRGYQAQHHQLGQGGDCPALLRCALYWSSLTLSAGGNSGHPNIIRTLSVCCYAAGAAFSFIEALLHKGSEKPRQCLALDYTSADTPLSELEQTSKSIDSSAHMITTARVPADKPVRIAFSLNDSPDDASPENFSLAFPELDQQLQPLPPCHDSKESMQVYKQHCKIAEEYHEVKKEIALLEERKKELIARLEQVEKESMDAARLAKEYAQLTEENRTLKLAQTQCVEQLEKLRIQYQKRQGSS